MEHEEFSEESALEIIDLIQTALYFAGVRKQALEEATEAYLEALESQDEDLEYDRDAMIALIQGLRKSHKHFFGER
ncbi:MAG: hypothetical protein K2N12_03680 [Helicobacter sp.]|nr:hypothetical protein [Helicobacter sp.]